MRETENSALRMRAAGTDTRPVSIRGRNRYTKHEVISKKMH